MSGSPPRKRLRRCIHVGSNVTLKQGRRTPRRELRHAKEQLANAENVIAYLSERVNTYRYRWLEEYYCADNLERHMPCDIDVPELGQIPEGLASPALLPESFTWDKGSSEWGNDEVPEQQGTTGRTTPGEGENYGIKKNFLAGNEMHRS
ncbi:hypothetical protein F4604DRAFT_1934350 [Suillus subluteus]|nr:hypothetical protein F4604DRAFT_1934350 [Suillus subluteus]